MGHERRRCNRRLPVNFRYAPLATEVVRGRNMSLRARRRHEQCSKPLPYSMTSSRSERHWRCGEAKRLAGLEVDHQIELFGRCIGKFAPSQSVFIFSKMPQAWRRAS
jgi:hypothetical protein